MVQESTNNNVGAAAGAIAPLGLPLHTRLGEFEIIDVIGEGGFSIVYLARDHQLQRTVAIKEYLPGAIAYRNADGMVQQRFEKYESTFKTGLQSVLKEARVLAQFEHHSLIRIHRFWEQNGTAYMVMQYCQGKTLRQILQTDATRGTDEVWLKQIMAPVLDALRMLHSRHYFHRDLSPDNIMILESGAPMLLDFGAARQVIGDMTQALTVILKPGFAPIEQYADDESMRQGPWTDIYGVGAVLYYAVTGKAPTASVARLVKDPLKKLATLPDIGVSQEFAGAIDHALGLFPADRPQSVDDFLAEATPEDKLRVLAAYANELCLIIAQAGPDERSVTGLQLGQVQRGALAADVVGVVHHVVGVADGRHGDVPQRHRRRTADAAGGRPRNHRGHHGGHGRLYGRHGHDGRGGEHGHAGRLQRGPQARLVDRPIGRDEIASPNHDTGPVDHPGQVHPGQVVAVPVAVRRGVQVGAGVGGHADGADRELGRGWGVRDPRRAHRRFPARDHRRDRHTRRVWAVCTRGAEARGHPAGADRHDGHSGRTHLGRGGQPPAEPRRLPRTARGGPTANRAGPVRGRCGWIRRCARR